MKVGERDAATEYSQKPPINGESLLQASDDVFCRPTNGFEVRIETDRIVFKVTEHIKLEWKRELGAISIGNMHCPLLQ